LVSSLKKSSEPLATFAAEPLNYSLTLTIQIQLHIQTLRLLLPVTLVCGINLCYLWFRAAGALQSAARESAALPVARGVSD